MNIEEKEKIADLSKGWQQFILGAILFFFSFGFVSYLAMGSMMSAYFGYGTGMITQPSVLISKTLSSTFIFILALGYLFGVIFFVVKFIKRASVSSTSDLALSVSIIAGSLLLATVLAFNLFRDVISLALRAGNNELLGKQAVQMLVKALGAIAFYSGIGYGLTTLGDRLGIKSFSLEQTLELLVAPSLVISGAFYIGVLANSLIGNISHLSNANWNMLATYLILSAMFLGSYICITTLFSLRKEFTSIAFRIAGGTFFAVVLVSLLQFSPLLSSNLQTASFLDVLAQFFEWLFNLLAFSVLGYIMFRMSEKPELSSSLFKKPPVSFETTAPSDKPSAKEKELEEILRRIRTAPEKNTIHSTEEDIQKYYRL